MFVLLRVHDFATSHALEQLIKNIIKWRRQFFDFIKRADLRWSPFSGTSGQAKTWKKVIGKISFVESAEWLLNAMDMW